jgi:hypothetical protein
MEEILKARIAALEDINKIKNERIEILKEHIEMLKGHIKELKIK